VLGCAGRPVEVEAGGLLLLVREATVGPTGARVLPWKHWTPSGDLALFSLRPAK
jgi:hypothetical protein